MLHFTCSVFLVKWLYFLFPVSNEWSVGNNFFSKRSPRIQDKTNTLCTGFQNQVTLCFNFRMIKPSNLIFSQLFAIISYFHRSADSHEKSVEVGWNFQRSERAGIHSDLSDNQGNIILNR